jgi:hypothetical protein
MSESSDQTIMKNSPSLNALVPPDLKVDSPPVVQDTVVTTAVSTGSREESAERMPSE